MVHRKILRLKFKSNWKESYFNFSAKLKTGMVYVGGHMYFLIFVLIPIVEMWILIEIGMQIGAIQTVVLVVLTASLGLFLLKRQGLSVIVSARHKMQQGALPASELVGGVLIAIGGALLLTPGFITDLFGFSLLIPQTRHWLLLKLVDRFRDKIIVEGEYSRIDDRNF